VLHFNFEPGQLIIRKAQPENQGGPLNVLDRVIYRNDVFYSLNEMSNRFVNARSVFTNPRSLKQGRIEPVDGLASDPGERAHKVVAGPALLRLPRRSSEKQPPFSAQWIGLRTSSQKALDLKKSVNGKGEKP
jgi:hypothetical protein